MSPPDHPAFDMPERAGGPQVPPHVLDPMRLAALDALTILHTPPEAGFDGIVQLAAQICETPVALVSFVAADRQWFKARIGFEPCETPLGSSVCAHALTEPDLLVVPDLSRDPRTRDNPLVTQAPNIRFYAGAPFRAGSGEVLGSLCVIDAQPRPAGLTPTQADSLRNLARLVTSLLELRQAIVDRDRLVAAQSRTETFRIGLLQLGDRLRDLSTTAEMTREAARIIGETLAVSRAGFGLLDQDGDTLAIEPDWTAPGVASIAGRYRFSDYGDLRTGLVAGEPLVIHDVCDDPRTAATQQALLDLGVRALVNMPVREHGRTVAVLVVHDGARREWTPEVLAFLRNAADRVELGIARLKAEADQRILNHELSHRLKNTFATIQAVATQSLRQVPDQLPVKTFIRRIHALAAAHDVLIEQQWSSARLEDVVGTVFVTLSEAARFDISGPDIELGPQATLSVSLLLHELTTNALKYGSLSVDEGRVAVAWRLEGPEDRPELALDWRETGGPPAEKPTRTGFGSKLIRMGLMGTGGVGLHYLPTGFQAAFRAPFAHIRHS